MTAPTTCISPPESPAERKLATFQASRLSRLTGVSTRQLLGESLGSLTRALPPAIHPDLLGAVTLSGRVVRVDAATGRDVPVARATVHLEDTDCQLVGFFPRGWPWAWYFPLSCRREEIERVTTDADGAFSIRVPRFDIDWILRWRYERWRHADLFRRAPLAGRLALDSGAPPALKVAAAVDEAWAARRNAPVRRPPTAVRRRCQAELPAPLAAELGRYRGDATSARAVLAEVLDVSATRLDGFDLTKYAGPFERPADGHLPEWVLLTDVPDITFRVSEGDATQYGDANFDVQWATSVLPDVTLVATPARDEAWCDSMRTRLHHPAPPPRPRMVGLAPKIQPGGSTPPYIDLASGYTSRPTHDLSNPLDRGALDLDAAAPFAGTLQLYGDVRVPGAAYYRVLRSNNPGATFIPFVGLSWPVYRSVAGELQVRWTSSDADGWYPIPPVAEHWFPGTLLLEWPQAGPGRHLVRIECADSDKHPLGQSSRVVEFDNTDVQVLYHQLAWKFVSEPDDRFDDPSRDLLVPCPAIRRNGVSEPIQILFRVGASPAHFRYASLGASGCGEGDFVLAEDPDNHTSHWYTSASDPAATLRGRFQLDGGPSEGAYSFNVYASSRWSENGDGHAASAPNTAKSASPIYVSPTIPVAIHA
ncbi:MAG: hypothetical protein U0132_05215 [Gemmatimonadaceae bacterium]